MMGKPTGDPLARLAFAEVTVAAVTESKLTLRVDLDLNDGRTSRSRPSASGEQAERGGHRAAALTDRGLPVGAG